MQGVRIYEMPKCKMVSSGIGMFGEEKFERFMEWFSLQERSMFPKVERPSKNGVSFNERAGFQCSSHGNRRTFG